MRLLFCFLSILWFSLRTFAQENFQPSSNVQPEMFTYKRLSTGSTFDISRSSLHKNAVSLTFTKSRSFADFTTCQGYYRPFSDTSYTGPYPMKRHFWRASAEWTLSQLIPWSFNYFVRDADFAHITWESIQHNLKLSSWTWDDNKFTTNQFAHPYHGNLYFNAFRTNGYSFWQSAPASLVGSFVWEVAGETHPPAPNDLINTTLGGISLGEMTYRISNRIINKRQRGFKRQMTEVFSLLINPANGVNRLLDGQWGKVSGAPLTDLDTMKVVGIVDVGARQISSHNGELFTKGKLGWYAAVRLEYGNPFVASKKAFNNFNLRVEVGNDDSAKVNIVYVDGLLRSWDWKQNEKTSHILSLTSNYNFFHNSQFEYGAQNINFSVFSEYNKGNKVRFISRLGAGAIVLAAIPNTYLYYGEGRNYDYGPGVSLIGRAGMHVNRFSMLADYNGGWFSTVNGSNSSYFLHAVHGEARYQFYENFSIGISGGYFLLHGYYADFEDVDRKYPVVRLSIGVRI